MGYADYLKQLLRPLGVYDLSDGSFSAGELDALGGALDALWAEAQSAQAESIVSTAADEGLSRYEKLFGVLPASRTNDERRAAVAALLRIGGGSFSADALSPCLAACGVAATVAPAETAGTLCVRFPDVMGAPPDFARIQQIIEMILPCHLAIEYALRYLTWDEAAALTWAQAGTMTWSELMCYQPPAQAPSDYTLQSAASMVK